MLISVYCLFTIYPWVDFRYFRDKFPEALVSTCLAWHVVPCAKLTCWCLYLHIYIYICTIAYPSNRTSQKNYKKHCLKIKIHGFPEKNDWVTECKRWANRDRTWIYSTSAWKENSKGTSWRRLFGPGSGQSIQWNHETYPTYPQPQQFHFKKYIRHIKSY